MWPERPPRPGPCGISVGSHFFFACLFFWNSAFSIVSVSDGWIFCLQRLRFGPSSSSELRWRWSITHTHTHAACFLAKIFFVCFQFWTHEIKNHYWPPNPIFVLSSGFSSGLTNINLLMSPRRTDGTRTDMQAKSKSERHPTGHARFTAMFHPRGWWALSRVFCTLSQNTLNKQSKQINTSTGQVKYRTNTVHWRQSASGRVHLSNLSACPRAPPGKIKASIFYLRPDS